MDKTFRNDMLDLINPEAKAMSTLSSIDREYSLNEIAIMTRAAPARSLGLSNRGHLGHGAIADITVYTPDKNREKMFATPDWVFKDGVVVARNGKTVHSKMGTTHTVKPTYDASIEKYIKKYFDDFHTITMGNFKIDNDEIVEFGRGSVTEHPCQRG